MTAKHPFAIAVAEVRHRRALHEVVFVPCRGGPMDGSLVNLRAAYNVIRLPDASEGEYRRTHVDYGRWEFRWVKR